MPRKVISMIEELVRLRQQEQTDDDNQRDLLVQAP